MAVKPQVNSEGQKELQKLEQNFDNFKKNVDDLTEKRSVKSEAPEHQISQKQIENSTDLYIKPNRIIMSREKFNEAYREQYNYMKEYVHYTVQHEECKGDSVELWTKPFPGLPAEFWIVPSGRAVWIPRYVADRLENECQYKRLKMQDTRPYANDGTSQMTTQIVYDDIIHRISARPVSTSKRFSMHRPAGAR